MRPLKGWFCFSFFKLIYLFIFALCVSHGQLTRLMCVITINSHMN